MPFTPDQISTLEASYGRILHITGSNDAWTIVLRKPKRTEYKQFRSKTHDPKQISDAQEILVRQIIVGVDGQIAAAEDKAALNLVREQFDKLLEEWPGIPEACGDSLQELVGMAGSEQTKSG